MSTIFRTTLLALIVVLVSFPARGAVINLVANLDPSNEVPPAVAPGATGDAAMVLDTDSGEFGWVISFSGLTGDSIGAHFHEAPAGSNGAVVLNLDTDGGVVLSGLGAPAGVFAGGKTLAANEVTNILAGLWYINIHTPDNPGGEIRGQVLSGTFNPAAVVPVPAAVWLFGSGLLGLLGVARRKRT